MTYWIIDEDGKRTIVHKLYTFIIFVITITIFLVMLSLFIVRVQAQSSKDVSVIIILPDNVNSSANYSKFMRIINNDDIQGVDDNLSIYSFANHTCEGVYEIAWNSTRTINAYSETGFGVFSPAPFCACELCVDITPINFFDHNISNNRICKTIKINNFCTHEGNASEINETNIDGQDQFGENLTAINESGFEADETTEENETNTEHTHFNETLSGNNSLIQNGTNNYVNGTISNSSSSNASNQNLSLGENNQSNYTQSQNNSCCMANIIIGKKIYSDGGKVTFKIDDCSNGSKLSSNVEYWIEDSTRIVKKALNTTSKAEKSYTISSAGREKYYIIKAKSEFCENITEEIFAVTSVLNEQFLEVISPEVIQLSGKTIFASVNGYKGQNEKTVVSVWIDEGDTKNKISQVTKFYVNEQNTQFSLKVPLLINENSGGLKKARIVAEGLGEKDEVYISIEQTEQEKTDTKDAEEKDEIKEGEIISIYSRKRIYEPIIPIYISIENPENKKLIIKGEEDVIILENLSEKNEVNISVFSEQEKVTAELVLGEEVIDRAEIKLNLTRREKNISPDLFMENFRQFRNETGNNTNHSLLATSSSELTGGVAAVTLDKKSAIFIIFAVIISMIILGMKMFGRIRKKTNLFKQNGILRNNGKQGNQKPN